MAIVGDHPETGVRFVLERLERGANAAAPWRYEGHAFTKDEAFPIVAVVDAAGQVEASGAATPADLVEKARLVVRALARAAVADGGAPPRRIVRWRGEK